MNISWKDALPLVIPFVIVGGLVLLLTKAPAAPELTYVPKEYTGSEVMVQGQPSGAQAIISTVSAKTASFITVHESLSGAPAQIIGQSALLPVGDYSNVAIRLTQETLPGYRYIVLLMADDGDGVYEPGIDVPVMSEGQVIKRDFVTTPEEE